MWAENDHPTHFSKTKGGCVMDMDTCDIYLALTLEEHKAGKTKYPD